MENSQNAVQHMTETMQDVRALWRIINRLVTALHTRSMIAYPEKSHAEIQEEVKRIVGPFDYSAAYDDDITPPKEKQPTHAEREHEMTIDKHSL